ncbi:unannotated protein [freshwater metagenome]|uniref:Unannotated protein n=1 Tax=freshwater metagenome TaxID=449393 RepID=A0A6J7XV93_9ZZZZ|nr:hypothetical protein [Actinomycetota bacterium]
MKKILSAVIATAFVMTLGVVSTSTANAVNTSACNEGTFNAFHQQEAKGKGLLMIGEVCHSIG